MLPIGQFIVNYPFVAGRTAAHAKLEGRCGGEGGDNALLLTKGTSRLINLRTFAVDGRSPTF